MDPILHRIVEGSHSLLVSAGGIVRLEAPATLTQIAVDCRRFPRPLEPLAQIEAEVRRVPLRHGAIPHGVWPPAALVQDTLGEVAGHAILRGFVMDLNRLAALSDEPVVVILHAAQAAHASTLWALVRLLSQGVCEVPLVIGVDRVQGEALEALAKVDGVLELEAKPGDAAPAEATERDAGDRPPDLSALPDDLLLVLRAAALLGSPFEAPLVGRLLGADLLDVLGALQRAADLGVPLRDLDEGRLALPGPWIEALTASLLPSLRRAWHERAARLLAEQPHDPSAAPRALDRPEAAAGDAARAADHARQAGQAELAVEQALQAARRATDLGAFEEALSLLEQASGAIVPSLGSAPLRRLRVALEIQLARVHWVAASESSDFSLTRAIEALERCEALLRPEDPASLHAELGATIAGVRYDMGDAESLEIALRALTRAQRALLDAGEPAAAARLLANEAGVWLRIGDPVRAHRLLERTRDVFAGLAAQDESARLEMARTDHLLARLLLRAPPREGRAQDAIALGLEHAERAAEVFTEQGRRLDLGRAEETLGRLYHAAGKASDAARHLVQAGRLQRALGDGIGLARSAAALSELLGAVQQPEAALELLSESIEMNALKASSQGLAFNRQGLDSLLERLPTDDRQRFGSIIEALDQRLRAAEDSLAREAAERPGQEDS